MSTLRIALAVALLAAACGGGDSTEAPTTAASATTTTVSSGEAAVATTDAVEQATPVEHPFDQYARDEMGMIEITVRNPDTGEWNEWKSPADAMATWYCSGSIPAVGGGWSYTFEGADSTPEAMKSSETWKSAFWDVADEMVCGRSGTTEADAPTQPPATTAAPSDDSGSPAADLVAFFYPGYELDSAIPDAAGPATLRLVGRSINNPDFRIIFDVARSDVASEGCDFTYTPSGETWCHSTTPSGLEALAGRDPMMPASSLAAIEAELAGDDIVVTDFQLDSNVAITLLAIAPSSVANWDGVSFEQEIPMRLDLASGSWKRS